ncbi:unnamed protein product [marine sediment metagenome]|uniref:Uncharacterized protein n=1 Tax=marine sediment metagenome TaxID=412755 RepID=X0SMC2_9ZZZZ
MIKNLDELAKFVKGGADVLQKAIDSEDEQSLEFIEGSFVSDGDLEATKLKVRNEGKTEGQTIGYDFAMKDLKKDFGIEIEGKDRKIIGDAIKTNILADANKKPDAKILELETSLGNLRKELSTGKEAWETAELSYKGQLKDVSIMSELRKNTPEIKGLNMNQFTTLVKSEYGFDLEDGVLIAKKNGQPVKDKMEQIIPVKDILTDYATQNGWFDSNGRKGKDEQGGDKGDFKTINDVYKHMETNNIQPNSPEGEKMIENFNKD